MLYYVIKYEILTIQSYFKKNFGRGESLNPETPPGYGLGLSIPSIFHPRFRINTRPDTLSNKN